MTARLQQMIIEENLFSLLASPDVRDQPSSHRVVHVQDCLLAIVEKPDTKPEVHRQSLFETHAEATTQTALLKRSFVDCLPRTSFSKGSRRPIPRHRFVSLQYREIHVRTRKGRSYKKHSCQKREAKAFMIFLLPRITERKSICIIFRLSCTAFCACGISSASMGITTLAQHHFVISLLRTAAG